MVQGEEALDRGDLSGAKHAFERAVGANEQPTAAARWFRLGKAYLDTGEEWALSPARQSFYRALKADREFPGPRLELARMAIGERNLDEALKLLKREQQIENTAEVQSLLAQVVGSVSEQQHQEEVARSAQQREDEEIVRQRQEQAGRALEAKRLLQAQEFSAGGLRCQTIDYSNIGRSFGDEMSSATAGGTYVAVLLKCTNDLGGTKYFPSGEIVLLDPSGRSYSVDFDASLQFAISKQDEEVANPEGLQLHPDLPRYIALMFDVPISLAESKEVRLKFGPHRFQLNFANDEPQSQGAPDAE